jgi:hypothetical protein
VPAISSVNPLGIQTVNVGIAIAVLNVLSALGSPLNLQLPVVSLVNPPLLEGEGGSSPTG